MSADDLIIERQNEDDRRYTAIQKEACKLNKQTYRKNNFLQTSKKTLTLELTK